MSEKISEQFFESEKEVKLSLLDEGPYSIRKTMEPEALEELADSIKVRGGVQDAIAIVHKSDGSGRYWIIYGNRRARAAVIAGKETIRSRIFSEDLPEEERYDMSDTENKQREDLTEIELAELIDRLVKRSDGSKQKAAQRLGITVAEVQKWLNFKKSLPEIPELTAENLDVADFIVTHFDESLWKKRYDDVKPLHRDDAIAALRKMVKGFSPGDAVKNLMERKSKQKKGKKSGEYGWIHCRITDNILLKAIGSAAEIDGLPKQHFVVECAKREVVKRGFYKLAAEAVRAAAAQ